MVVAILLSFVVGGECANGAGTPTTRVIQAGADAGLLFVTDGENLRTSLQTWEKSLRLPTRLTALTMMVTTNLAIADGLHPKNNSETADATSS